MNFSPKNKKKSQVFCTSCLPYLPVRLLWNTLDNVTVTCWIAKPALLDQVIFIVAFYSYYTKILSYT